MLHPKRVATALYYALRQRTRRALRIPARAKPPPVLGQSLEHIVKWHSFILDTLIKHLPQGLDLTGKHVCEVGAGDCLAVSSFLLARGARHVDIIEIQPPVLNEKQYDVLKCLKTRGYPIDLGIIQAKPPDNEFDVDSRRVTYQRCYMENLSTPHRHDFIFSSFVLEHVEDLTGFYATCWNTMNAGGRMLHLIDLGGHGLLEDPLPPLDFQTYPDWLYSAMAPKYYRATRRFLDEHMAAAKSAGFRIEQMTPIRKADESYLAQVWPRLRPAARQRPRDEIGVIEFALLAQKPATINSGNQAELT